MLGVVHACIGAGVGSLCKSKGAAFIGGVLSHLVTDVVPHTDCSPKLDVPLMVGVLAAIAKWRGTGSPEFWGAVGGIVPDAEHGLVMAGVMRPEQEVFPSHVANGNLLHGQASGERWSQLFLAAASLLAVAANDDARSAPADRLN